MGVAPMSYHALKSYTTCLVDDYISKPATYTNTCGFQAYKYN